MLGINPDKLYNSDCTVEQIKDGSVRLLKYIEPPKGQGELLTLTKSYYSGAEYTMRVNLPRPPKLDIVIIVSHTSANCWQLIVSTPQDTWVDTRNTLTAINVLLQHHLK